MVTAQHTGRTIDWQEQGAALISKGHSKEALKLYQQAIKINPDDVVTIYNAGVACQTMGDYAQAVGYYQSAIQHHPKFTEAHHNLAQAYVELGRYQLAVNSYQDALRLNPFDYNSAYNLALLYHKMDHAQAAITACQSAIQAKPDFAEAFSVLGMIYREQSFIEEASVCLEQALEIKPDLAQAHYEMGVVSQKMGDCEKGRYHYQKAMEIDPGLAPALWLYRLSLPMIYDNQEQIAHSRQRFQTQLSKLIQSISLHTAHDIQFALRGVETTTNFFLQYQCHDDAALQKQYGHFVHEIMAANYPCWASGSEMPERRPGEAIRIGYVSTYMYDHTIGTFLSGWIKNHTKEKFEIHCYHVGKKVDAMTRQIEQQSHSFYHLPGDLIGAAGQIQKDRLHLLVYTDIGMDPLTTQLAALRLAPIQCKGWGHPVTTGLPTIDFYLSSDLMEPHHAESHYSETLVRLPNLALCYSRPQLPQEPVTNASLGLPANRFIYLSTQSLFKYLPQHDDLYPRIALAVPQACFVFISNQSEQATKRFRLRIESAFKAHGLDAKQFCYYSPRLSYPDFLSLNLAADVLLDSMEWSGGKTTLEALSCGLPVVTYPGRFMRGRHAYAMLRMLGVTDTIADSKVTYCNLAARLGNDPVFYGRIQRDINANLHLLYDDQIFITALEKFYASTVKERLISKAAS